jgi:hypothetical protein
VPSLYSLVVPVESSVVICFDEDIYVRYLPCRSENHQARKMTGSGSCERGKGKVVAPIRHEPSAGSKEQAKMSVDSARDGTNEKKKHESRIARVEKEAHILPFCYNKKVGL